MQYQEFYAVHAETGKVLPFAWATIRISQTGALAQLYGIDGGQLDNPLQASSVGLVGFRVADGEYDIVFQQGPYTAPPITRILFFDPVQLLDTSSGLVARAEEATYVSQLYSNCKYYETDAAMRADVGQPNPKAGLVTNDPDPDLRGFSIWYGTEWVRSAYQPALPSDAAAAIAAKNEAQAIADEFGDLESAVDQAQDYAGQSLASKLAAALSEAAAAGNAQLVQVMSDAIVAAFGSISYLEPVSYAAGLSMTLAAQTVGYNGNTYAPRVDKLPFTTSGTFESDKFRLIQGVAGADLGATTGSLMVGDRHTPTAIPLNMHDRMKMWFSARDYIAGENPVAATPLVFTIRNNGDKSDKFNHWKPITTSGHATLGLRSADGPGTEVETNPNHIRVRYDTGADITLGFQVTVDNDLARTYLRVGASVGHNESLIYMCRDIMAAINRSAAGVWTIGVHNGVKSVEWDSVRECLTVNHAQCPNAAINVDVQGANFIGMWDAQPAQVDDYKTRVYFTRKQRRDHSARVEWNGSAWGFVGNSQNIAIQSYNPANGDLVLAFLGGVVAPVAVSSVTRSGAVATMVTGAAHGLRVNDWVRSSGANETEYNGWFQVKTVPDTTSITFDILTTPASPATGSLTYTANRAGNVFAYSLSLTRYATNFDPEIKASDEGKVTVNIRNDARAVVTGTPTTACKFVVSASSRSQPEMPPAEFAIGLRWNSASYIDPRSIDTTDYPGMNLWCDGLAGKKWA